MSPRLRVLAGTSPDTMVPITSIVNTSKAHSIHSDLFQGQIVVNIKGMTDEHGRVRDSEYFDREDRQGVTWSIQVQGRFLIPTSADDILFGNTFDRPLKLPWGTSAILKFMHYIDPTLEHDLLSSTKPWALSPLICTMPHLIHTRVPSCTAAESSSNMTTPGQLGYNSGTCPLPRFPPTQSIIDSTDELYLTVVHGPSSASSSGSSPASSGRSTPTSLSSGKSVMGGSSKIRDVVKKVARRRRESSVDVETDVPKFEGAAQRRSYFSSAPRRQLSQFGPMDVITTDFCYGFISFSPSLSLQLPGGISVDLMKYWDGQPVRFVCCERKGVGSEPWGRVFWCVAIEVIE